MSEPRCTKKTFCVLAEGHKGLCLDSAAYSLLTMADRVDYWRARAERLEVALRDVVRCLESKGRLNDADRLRLVEAQTVLKER